MRLSHYSKCILLAIAIQCYRNEYPNWLAAAPLRRADHPPVAHADRVHLHEAPVFNRESAPGG